MKQALYTAAAAVIIFALIKHCSFKSEIDTDTIVKTDTVPIIKYLPSKTNEFVKTDPKHVYVTKYIDNSKEQLKLLKKIENKYNQAANNNILLRELLQARKKRTYTETFKDSVLNAEVSIFTEGKLDSVKFKYKTLPIKIEEKIITNYITPQYRLLVGFNGVAGDDNITGLDFGLQTKKGNIYSLGVNSNANITFGFKLCLFEKY